jgi:hypothetical protein
MEAFRFTWDIRKSDANLHKHGVSFDEAETVFADELAREFYDPSHSSLEEDRFLLLGTSSKLRLLMICHCFRENDREVRIISARKATRTEALFYTERE